MLKKEKEKTLEMYFCIRILSKVYNYVYFLNRALKFIVEL